jgi:hypothetical protein
VERAAAKNLQLSTPVAVDAAAVVFAAAETWPVNIRILEMIRTLKNKNTLNPRAALKPPFVFLLLKKAPKGITILNNNAITITILVTMIFPP